MARWSRIVSYAQILKELQCRAWLSRWPKAASQIIDTICELGVALHRAHFRATRRKAVLTAAGSFLVAAYSSAQAQNCLNAPCFQGLGDLSGGSVGSWATAISADGTTVVGRSASGNGTEAFRWRVDIGLFALGSLPGGGFFSESGDVSSDGETVVGTSWSDSNTQTHTQPFIWTSAGGMIGLGQPPAPDIYWEGRAVSDDGFVIGGGDQGWYKLGSGSLTAVALPAGFAYRNVTGVTPNGSHILGHAFTGGAGTNQATIWEVGGGYLVLGDLPGGPAYSSALDGSPNAAVVVGYGHSATGQEAFRWTTEQGLVSLGDLPGGPVESVALALTNNGSLIVGAGRSETGYEAVIWDEAQALHLVANFLMTNGVSVPMGWSLSATTGITVNANVVTLCGTGTNPQGDTEAWIARYSTCDPGPDCNSNGTADDCDIAEGTSTDCDTNGVPDECQTDDYDGDGLIDPCDPDIDDDGVANAADVCDFTPAGAAVQPDGTLRSDIDGDCDVDLADHAIMAEEFTGPRT